MRKPLIIIGIVLFLSACSTGQDASLPTLAGVEVVPDVTVTTEVQTDVVVPTDAPTATQLRRPTLPPPILTVTPTPTETPTVTPIAATPIPALVVSTPNADCNFFDVVYEESSIEFELGTSPKASWTAVNGAQLYRLALRQSSGFVINDNIYIAETTYTFPSDLFFEGFTYGWDVYPINNAGDQMCFAVGSELIPRRSRLPGS